MAQGDIAMYDYEQLDLTKQQIRLLSLHPAADPSDPISCDIKTFDTEAGPHYIALSYTWGSPNPERTVLINGRRLSVRQNLFDFLLRYRNDPSNVHYLWVDQICISQAHAGERNHQVRLMSHIYMNGLCTIIWLGEDSRRAAQSFQGYRNFEDADTLLSNRYFNRLWVVQEILLSPQRRVLCGDLWLDLEELVTCVNFLDGCSVYRHPPLGRKYMLVGRPFDRVTALLEGYLEHPPKERYGQRTLEYCMRKFGSYDCEDPRDKVYGLQSLVHESSRLEVDYSKSKEEVFLQVVMCSVRWRSMRQAFQGYEAIDVMTVLDLSHSMGLHEHREVLRGVLRELRDRWAISADLNEIELGFERRSHPNTANWQGPHLPRRRCCFDRWWVQWNGVRYHRDQRSYNEYGLLTHGQLTEVIVKH